MIYTKSLHTHVGENFETVEHTFEGSVEDISEVLEQLHQQELEKEMDKHVGVKCGKNDLPGFIRDFLNQEPYKYSTPEMNRAIFNVFNNQ